MGIYTAYDIGDKVFCLFDNGIHKFEVIRIEITVWSDGNPIISYEVKNEEGDVFLLSESRCHESPEDIITKLLEECKERTQGD